MKKNCGYLATRKPRQRNRFLAISGHMLELNTEICLYLIYKNCGNLATRKPPQKKKNRFLAISGHMLEWNGKICRYLIKKTVEIWQLENPPKKQISSHFWSRLVDFWLEIERKKNNCVG
jgi:hypothetical protein